SLLKSPRVQRHQRQTTGRYAPPSDLLWPSKTRPAHNPRTVEAGKRARRRRCYADRIAKDRRRRMEEISSSCVDGFRMEACFEASKNGLCSGGKTDTGESEHSGEFRK